MKKILLLTLVFLQTFMFAQTTPSYKNVKLTQLPLGTKNDSIVLTNGSTKLLKFIPVSQIKVPTNLTFTATPTGGTVFSSTGTDATLPLATTSDAGLLSPTDKTNINGVQGQFDTVNTELDIVKSQINPNTYVVYDAGYSQNIQNITINTGWQWKINNVNKTNVSPVVINIPLATTGYQRIDLIVLNALNTAVRVAGTETAGTPVSPAVPLNTIQILFITTDSTVSTPVIPKPKNQVSQFLRNGETGYSPSEDVVYDALVLKQPTLVSATNIKTINGNSLLGSGDLTLGSGGGTFVKSISDFNSESYGDSITFGQGSTAGNSYVELFSSLYQLTNTNRAVSARGIWESTRLHNLNINPGNSKTTIVMAGFNDVRRGGNSVKTISKIKNGYRAIIVNQFLKTFVPANSTGGTITNSGTWLDYTGDLVGGKSSVSKGLGGYSSTIGHYKEYTFKGDNVVLGMIGTDGVFEVHGNFDVTIDGVLIGNYTGNNKTDGISDGSNNNARAPYILYFGGLTDATHTIRVTVTSSNYVAIDYFGNLLMPKFTAPLILVEAPKMNSTGYATAPALATDAIINELNTEIESVAAEFNSNYPIIVAKTNNFYNVSTGLSGDNIHPNDIGYRQIYSSIVSASNDLFLLRNATAGNILSLNNTFTGLNTFSQELRTQGIQSKGSFNASNLAGPGAEMEYAGGIAYFTGYDRTGLFHVPVSLRAKTFSVLTFNGTGGGYGIEKMKIFENGNTILQNGGTFTDTGERLKIDGSLKVVKEIKTSEGILVQGTFATAPTGAGFEMEYFSGVGYVTAYNRTASSYLPISIRSLTTSFSTGGTENGKILQNGNIIFQTGGTFTDNGNKLQITGNASVSGVIKSDSVIRLKNYTVSTLPTGTQGDTAFVTDATSPTYLGALTGGGSIVCPVFYNGTSWVSH